MFGMGMPEIILILAIALIVLGPKKLPEIAKSLGKGIAEFKKATSDFKQSINTDNDFKQAKDTLQGVKGDLQDAVHSSMHPDATAGARNAVDEDEDDEDDDEAVGKNEPVVEEEKQPATTSSPPDTEEKLSDQAKAEDKEKGPSTHA
jgi:TatA/E family protein of Tat protein translocase